jgi:hypothetical protein
VKLIKHCGAEIVPGPYVQLPKQMHNDRAKFAPLKDLLHRFMDSLAAAIGK